MASFTKLKSSIATLGGPGGFISEFKKMYKWWCEQPGHAGEKQCMLQAGKKIDKAGPKPAKSSTIWEIRTSYCSVADHKETTVCKLNSNMMKTITGMSGGLKGLTDKIEAAKSKETTTIP